MTDRTNNITAKNLFTVIKYHPDGIAARITLNSYKSEPLS